MDRGKGEMHDACSVYRTAEVIQAQIFRGLGVPAHILNSPPEAQTPVCRDSSLRPSPCCRSQVTIHRAKSICSNCGRILEDCCEGG